MRMKAILFHILLILIPAFGLAAEEDQARTALPGADAGKASKGPLIIAIDRDYPPQTFLNVDGQPTGIFVDIWRLWSKKTGKDIRFITSNWKDTLTNLKNGKADIHSGLFYSDFRAEWIKFSQPSYGVGSHLFFKAGSKGIDGRGNLAGKKIGATSGSFQEEYLRKKYPRAEVVPFNNREEMIRAVLTWKIDALLAEGPAMTAILDRLGLTGQFQTSSVLFDKSFHAGVLKENNALLLLIDKGFDTISNRELAEIEKRWIPDPHKQYFKASGAKIRLTEKEKAWINGHSPIRVGFPWNFPPLFFKEDGTIKGIIPDYLRLVGSYSGLQFDFIGIPSNWEDLLRTHEIDMATGFDIPARKAYSRNTRPFMDLRLIVVGRNDMPLISGLKALDGTKTAVVKDAKIYNQILKNYPDIEHSPANTFMEALEAVASGKADNMMAPMVTVGYLLHDYPTLKILGLTGIPPAPYKYTVRKDFPELVNILNKALTAIPKAEKDAIVQKWFKVQIEHKTDWSILLKWIGGITLVFLLVLCIFLYWNKRLVKQITERKRAEEALRESRNFIDKIVNTAPNLVYIYDLIKNQNVYANAGIHKLLGFSVEEIQEMGDQLFLSLMHPDDLDKVAAHHGLLKQSADGKILEVDYRMKDSSGEYRMLRSWDTVFRRDREGTVQQIIGLAVDVTEQIQAQELLKYEKDRTQQYLDVAGVVLIALDKDGSVTLINPKGCEILAYSEDEIVGGNWFDNFLFSEDVKAVKEVFDQIVSGKAEPVRYYENPIKTRDGELRLIAWHNSVLKDASGNITGLFSSGQDITEQRRAEAERKTSEKLMSKLNALLTSVINQAPFAIHILEGEFSNINVVIENAESARIMGEVVEGRTGIDADTPEMLATRFFSIDGKQEIPLSQMPSPRAFQGEVVANEEFIFRHADGTQIMVEASASPIYDANNQIIAVTVIFQDITKRKTAEKEREQLTNQLAQSQKMEAIGTLAGGIAHDFNNILGIILGNTELAMDDVPEWNSARQNLDEVRTACLRAKDVVKQILSFSRKSETEQKPLNIAHLVTESTKLLRASIPTSIEIRQNISSGLHKILGDPTQIHQIMINLCTNAAHAMENDGGILEITLENSEVHEDTALQYPELNPGSHVHLGVSDTGDGIGPEVIDRVFDPYFTTKDVGKGTGLGLSVVHGIVKSHRGKISVESEMGKGTVFHMLFPAVKGPTKDEPKALQKLPTGVETILFVDDEASMVNLNRQRLERLGYRVIGKVDPSEALAFFQADPDQIDLIITDMTMPGMTGDRLAKEILKIRSDTPIILCTGYSQKISKETAGVLGIRKYIEKPIEKESLVRSVREVLDSEAKG